MDHIGKLTEEQIERVAYTIEVRAFVSGDTCMYYYSHNEEMACKIVKMLLEVKSCSKVEVYKI